MNHKELKELVDFLLTKDISEFEFERGDVRIRLKRGTENPVGRAVPPVSTFPSVSAIQPSSELETNAPSAAPQPAVEEELHVVKSPIVGTYYDSPGPGAPPFVKLGEVIAAGQVLCIIEAMKLMNE